MAIALLGKEHHEAAKQMTFRSVVAVAACVCVLTALGAVFSMPLLLVLPVYLAAEVLFAINWYYRFLMLSYQPIKHRPLSHDPISAFEKAMAHLQQFADIRHFLSIWFHGAQWEDIKRDNVADLIAYAFWYQTRDEIAAEGRAHELQAMVEFIEHAWGIEITPGHNPKLRWMCHLWEPMRCWYQPLGFYLFMELASMLASIALRAAGFRESFWCGLTYYTKNIPEHGATTAPQVTGAAAGQQQPGREHNSSYSTPNVPLVLLHGIGMGIIPYISLLFNIAATGRPVIALQFKHVAMRWVMWVPTVDEVAEALVCILRREGVQRCCLVAHSYGTAVASRLLQQYPEKVVQTCMIDPVCFSMFMPNLLRNFLYESPQTGNWAGDFMMLCAARDLHVSATLSRKFFWTDVNLWEEQLPEESLVVLSGKDILMAAPEVKAWLELRTDAVVMFHPDLLHAGFLLDIQWQQQILQQLLPLLDEKLEKQQRQLPPPSGSVPTTKRYQQLQDAGSAIPCSRASVFPCGSPSSKVLDRHAQQQQQQAPTTPQGRQQQQQQSSSSSLGTSCSMRSSFEISAVAAEPAGAPPALLRNDSGSSHSSAFASVYTTSSVSGISRGGGSMFATSVSIPYYCANDATEGAVVSKHMHDSVSKSTGNLDMHRSSLSSFANPKGTHQTCQLPMAMYPPHSQQQHLVGVDSDGCVVANLRWPGHLQASAGDDGYCNQHCAVQTLLALDAPGLGRRGPQPSLAGRGNAGGSKALMLVDSNLGSESGACRMLSPFMAAAANPLQQQQHHDTDQLQPIGSWTGVVVSAPAPCGESLSTSSSAPAASTCSAAGELESPRTFFSGCSSQSWQDLAALATAKDAATAAQILLQPVHAWQQRQHMQQQDRQAKQMLKQQQQPLHQQQHDEFSGGAALQRQGSTVSSKRDGMLRRVEVLLHRRQNWRRGHDGAAASTSGAARLAH